MSSSFVQDSRLETGIVGVGYRVAHYPLAAFCQFAR